MARPVEIEQMNATEAKNRFGEVLEKAASNKAVSLMRHGKPAAYVISPAMYEAVCHHFEAGQSALDRLEREFDDLLARMQLPGSAAAARNLMTIDTTELRQVVRQRPRRPGRHAR